MSRLIPQYLMLYLFSMFTPALAQPVTESRETPILTIQIYEEAKPSKIVELTLEDLKELPSVMFSTSTIWTTDKQSFTGIWMHTLLKMFDAFEAEIELLATNDYWIRLDTDTITSSSALLAYEQNGSPLSPRKYGPLWIVYDYDSDPQFRTETVYSQSIWQLNRIVISK